jgi:DNA-binding PadR family transcriptional regulator
MKPNSPLLRGSLIPIILKLLEDNGRMYGYEITRVVKENSGGMINLTEGALYPALHKLEADGLVETTIEQIDNRSRKYYRLSKKGKKETVLRLTELADYLKSMHLLLQPVIK